MSLRDELLQCIIDEKVYADAHRKVSARLDEVDRAGELFFGHGVPDREGLTRSVLRAHFSRLEELRRRVESMCEILGWERVASMCEALILEDSGML